MSTRNDPSAGDEVIVVLTTTADDESAGRLARALVEERLAACVTRMAAQSVYRWQKTDAGDPATGPASSEVCEESEVLLLIKSARSRKHELEQRILELHSYECPEIVVLEPQSVAPRYRAWLLAACT
ncbi:MAG TPA: divalent-cation tolerance protein CutA [Candidatus Limnocylindrales bacterium]|nr:divalent-cation tolerance protein CutA [Candidatus Limnocylindrales bacterium]